jgi:hypothetical protein
MRRVILCLVLLATTGCSGGETAGEVPTEPAGNLDCLYPLVWDDRYYEPAVELPASWKLGAALGPGVVLGCGSETQGYYPDESVDVRGVAGIHSSIAVATRLEGSSRAGIWAAPGYLIESPRHPLHEPLAPNWGDAELRDEFTCEETFRTRARSLTTPELGQGLEVVAVNPAVEELLVAPGGNRHVALDPATEITGLVRNGVPYVRKGDELMLVVSACWNENDPTAGGPLLLAESVRKI